MTADTSKFNTITFYINSNDNSYYISIRELNNYQPDFTFMDHNEKFIVTKLKAHQKDSIEINGIVFDNHVVISNSYKYVAKKYNLTKLNDTILNNKIVGRYLVKYKKNKFAKRKKLWSHKYFIDETQKLKPIIEHSTVYNIWQNNNGPNGVIIQKDNYNEFGNLIYSEKLIEKTTLDFLVDIKNEKPTVTYLINK